MYYFKKSSIYLLIFVDILYPFPRQYESGDLSCLMAGKNIMAFNLQVIFILIKLINIYHKVVLMSFTVIGIFLALVLMFSIPLNIKRFFNKKQNKKWAFFHPFCNDGGGGQKVLWCMIKALTQQTAYQIVVYSLQPQKDKILQKVKSRFGIKIDPSRFDIVHVSGKFLLTSKSILTMLLNILLPLIYGIKCLWKYQPDVLYDTTGYASVLSLAKFIFPQCTTVAYVHYPFISQDMIGKVQSQRQDFNNSQLVSKSPFLSKAKVYYYKIILNLYKLIGKTVDFAQTNSSWTHGHMSKLWGSLNKKGLLQKVYPPCTVQSLIDLKKPNCSKQIQIMSLAQFRPEKQQHLQLQVLAKLLTQKSERKIILKICGTTRGIDDQQILQKLRQKAKELNIQNNVEFLVNKPFSAITSCLQNSWLGIHTMEAEHFGISIVQMLAAGLLVVAHNSAGPKEDIICQPAYLANTKEEYIQKLSAILKNSDKELQQLSKLNRKKAKRFGQQQFKQLFIESLQPIKLKIQ